MKRVYTLKLTHAQAVTLHFAILNYRLQLRAEIAKPTRAHGPAEAAMSLTDLDELDRVFKEQITL